MPSAAAAVAGDGDTVLIDPGTYSGDVATWTQDDLSLRGDAGLALTAASLSYVTQRYVLASNTVTDGLPEAMAAAQRVMPLLSAVGMVVAGGVVPVALLAYWVCNSAWTLGRSAAVAHWFPTPGTAAYARRAG